MLWMTAETILSLCHIREGFIRKLNINLGFKIMNRDYLGLPRGLSGKESACQAGDGFYPWVQKIPWRRKWQPTPVCLPGESHGQRSLVGLGYGPWGRKASDTIWRLNDSNKDPERLQQWAWISQQVGGTITTQTC